MDFHTAVEKAREEGRIPEKTYRIILDFYRCYERAIENSGGLSMKSCDHLLLTLLELTLIEIKEPHHFQPFHRALTAPFNYYQFGLDFFRPLVDLEKSKIYHIENLQKMEEEIQRKENVILLANHQTEADPQLISLALQKEGHEEFAKEIIFVAGDRVVTDPMAIPMSMGRNLLCIFSKRHIENPIEQKRDKLLHNQRTLQRLKELLAEGGKTVFVAPSGGRDRRDNGVLEPAPFDPNSIELFRLLASQTDKKTHFYPFSLATCDILPPPEEVERELCEKRVTKRAPIFFAFGNEVDFSLFESMEKRERREAVAKSVYAQVKEEYLKMKKENHQP